MGLLDGLKSRADAVNADRLARDEHRRRRTERRPDWLPDDVPDGTPYVSLSAGYAGSEHPEAKVTDGVTSRVIDTDADVRLSDEQMAGWTAQVELAARNTARAELANLAKTAGGKR